MERIPYVPQLRPGDDMPVIDCDDDYQNDLLAMMNSEQPNLTDGPNTIERTER